MTISGTFRSGFLVWGRLRWSRGIWRRRIQGLGLVVLLLWGGGEVGVGEFGIGRGCILSMALRLWRGRKGVGNVVMGRETPGWVESVDGGCCSLHEWPGGVHCSY